MAAVQPSAVRTLRPSAVPARRALGPVARDQRRTGILFVIVPMALFLVFSVIPMGFACYLSFTDFKFTRAPIWTGLENFSYLATDKVFRTALRNTALYALGVVPTGMVLSLFVALLLNQKIRGIVIFRTAYYLPVVTSTVASAVVWMWMFATDVGILNAGLEMVGLPPQRWLMDTRLALPSVMFMSVWKSLGYSMIIYLAALQGIPGHLYEAAEIDGASSWHKFWSITLPLLKATTFFIFVTSVISSFQVFGSVFVMTQGGPGYATTTIVHQIYLNAFKYLRMGYGAAEALVLFAIIFILSMINWFFLRSDVEYW
ncbi:MAG: sugar ABC transporter permease [Anaerolineae bacterium]|nr:sugar ABC transporter permease [Anaerolineae bacterium]